MKNSHHFSLLMITRTDYGLGVIIKSYQKAVVFFRKEKSFALSQRESILKCNILGSMYAT